MSHMQNLQWRSLADLPVARKNAVGLYYKDKLLVAGGYTGRSQDDAAVHTYDPNFDIWSPLPSAPLKWSSLAAFEDKVLLIGGKEVGKPRAGYTNQLAVLDEGQKEWRTFYPPMQFARMSPVVHTHNGYLIVAGGSKGSLDYSFEIFDSRTRKWTVASPLPHKCFRNTSTIVDGVWYLLREDSGQIYCVDVSTVIQHTYFSSHKSANAYGSLDSTAWTPLASENGVPVHDDQVGVSCDAQNNVTWKRIGVQPPLRPFRITSLEGHLLALSLTKGAVSAHIYVDESWQHVGKLPFLVSTASVARADSLGQLFLFGGEGGCGHYSRKAFKASLVLKSTKKPKPHVVLDTTAHIINLN